jgi:CubicO group peptidase (beta-lactamase class C family)
MLVGGGVFGGRRYVSEAAIAQATSKQTGDRIEANYGFGFGADEGSFGHGGAWGTATTVDRKRGLIKVWLVQHPSYPEDVAEKVYAAFEEGVEDVAKHIYK